MGLYSKLKLGIVFLCLAVFFIILNITNFPKPVKNFFYLISSPVEKILWEKGRGVSDFFEGIFRAGILVAENRDLRFENQQLLSKISSLNDLKRENETLREVLNLGMKNDFKLLFAQIVSKDIVKDSLLIDRGLKDGIRKGFPAITSQKVLLGRVGEVYDNFSEVMLISNKESSFDAKVSKIEASQRDKSLLHPSLRSGKEKEIYGVVRGEGGLKLYMNLIPKEDEILENDVIVTVALGGIFPKGLLVGKVKSIKISDLEPFQNVELEPSFLLKDLDKIFIITNFK